MTALNSKIKLLVLADSPTVSTGFAQVSKNILKRLYKLDKYDITVLGINHTGDWYDQTKHPYKIYPAMPVGYSDSYGRGKIIQILKGMDKSVKPPFDLIFTIQDHFILQGSDFIAQGFNFSASIKHLQAEILKDRSIDSKYLFNWIWYIPVDGRLQEKWVKKGITYADYPVAYTNYAKEEILKFDDGTIADRISVIYHGVDTDVFKPISEEEKQEFRKRYFNGVLQDDSFLITAVSRNQIRKDFASTIKAFSEYKKINSKALLYIHAKQKDNGGDLWEIAKQFGLKEGYDMMLPNGFNEMYGLPIEDVNRIYNVSDVILSTTHGEGWGFVNTEAQAANKPIIAPFNTSVTEIFNLENAPADVSIEYIENNLDTLRGIPVKSGFGVNDFVNYGDMDNGVIRPKVDIEDVVKKLDWVYNNREKAQKIAHNGNIWVKSLVWDNIVLEWDNLFTKAYEELVKTRKEKDRMHKLEEKIRPNDPCFCGSGKKFKKCCGGK